MTIKFKLAALGILAGAVVSGSAFATEPGPYLGLGFGLHMPSDSHARAQIPAGSPSTNFDTDFNSGFLGVGSFGYKWDQGFRTELEVGYRQADLKTVHGASALGVQRDLGFSANVLYDFDNSSSLTPYIGGGIGVSSNKWRHVTTGANPSFTDRTSAFQWQGIVGVSLRLSRRLEAFADYRYIGAGNNQFDSAPRGSLVTNHSDRSHNILVGLRFSLGSPRTEAAAAPAATPPALIPAPMAEAPAPPVPQSFLVFFDFDKSALRPDAQKIVDEAADYAKRNGKSIITTTGHADTSGSSAYNMGLSERRAETVKAALAKHGFSDKEILVRWKGESEPLVQTGDGVKEPQNRRVEIILE